MDSVSLTFADFSTAYDSANPTKQTEELAYVMKTFLCSTLETAAVKLHFQTDEEAAETSETITAINDTCTELIAALSDFFVSFDNLSNSIQNIRLSIEAREEYTPVEGGDTVASGLYQWSQLLYDKLQTLQEPLSDLVDSINKYEYYERSSGTTQPTFLQKLEEGLQDIAAVQGIILDAPGSVVTFPRENATI